MSGRGMPGLPDVVVENDVPCVVRDGTTLVADVYRPRGAENSPVLLLRLPYDKTAAESNFGFAHPSWYAAHGYMVVVQDCRGAGGSEGGWYPFVHEADDGYDAIEWAARLPGSNGRVGTYGFSYPGYLQLQTACLRPPSLVTISPGFAAAQAYEGWTYDQGALRIAFVAFWAMLLELASLKRQGDEDGMQAQLAALGQMPELNWVLPLTAIPSLVETDYWQDWLAHPSYDGYWRPLSIDEDYSRITVSALHVGGWYDVFINGTADNFAGLRAGAGSEDAAVAQKLVIGPWLHGPWKPLVGAGGDAGSNIVDDWQLRWFDHVLKGEDNGALDAPATVYVVGDGWHDLDGWPPSRARPTDWFLHSRGRANTATGDGWLSTEPPRRRAARHLHLRPGQPFAELRGPLVLRRGHLAGGACAARHLRAGSGCSLLHVRAARASPRRARRCRAHALCGHERCRHRLDVSAVRGRRGHLLPLLDEHPGGHRSRSLSELGERSDAGETRRDRRVPDPPRPGGMADQGRPAAARRCVELRLPTVGS